MDGTDWQWQTLQEAFGLPERSEDANSFTEIQVAVGQDFVLAQVQTFEFPEAPVPSPPPELAQAQTFEFPDADFDEDADIGIGEGQSGSIPAPLTAPEISLLPPRWFIARIG